MQRLDLRRGSRCYGRTVRTQRLTCAECPKESRVIALTVDDGIANRAPFTAHASPASSVAVSPDGSRIAAGDESGAVLWDVATGAVLLSARRS